MQLFPSIKSPFTAFGAVHVLMIFVLLKVMVMVMVMVFFCYAVLSSDGGFLPSVLAKEKSIFLQMVEVINH